MVSHDWSLLEATVDRLTAPAGELSRSGLYPYPNPIGLPPLT